MKQDIRIYNTLSGKKELVKPFKTKKVNLFVCGPTVYDFSHIGHARIYLFFDFFTRYLTLLGYKVFYLQNITNIDDRIILRAKERGVLPQDLAKAFEKEYFKDMALLGINSVTKYARATDFIKEIIGQIARLVKKGYAYPLEDGIYFDIQKFKKYGKLSGRTALQAEDSVSRIDYSKNKKNRGDFCLWKFNEGIEGEPSWTSPFGKGRPGWHIEDTAITEKFFGEQYDIHGGGRDLIFPHHEAEVAQMEALSGKRPMAKYWMHVGFLTTNGQKMSKSLNNFITIGNLLQRHSLYELRLLVAKNYWRSPIDYSESTMIEVKAMLDKFEEFLRKLKTIAASSVSAMSPRNKKAAQAREAFYKELNDDFNTPRAFAVLFDLVKETNKLFDKQLVSDKEARAMIALFEEMNSIFGIIDFSKLEESNIPKEVQDLAALREDLRKRNEWSKSDEIRAEIEKYGYIVDDTKEGPVLRKK